MTLGTKGGGSTGRRGRVNDVLALGTLIAYTVFALFPLFLPHRRRRREVWIFS